MLFFVRVHPGLVFHAEGVPQKLQASYSDKKVKTSRALWQGTRDIDLASYYRPVFCVS